MISRAIAVSMILLLAACSERRSTGPGEPPEPPLSTRLPAMELVEDIVQRSSDWITAEETSGCGTNQFAITIPDSILRLFERIDDVRVGFEGSCTAHPVLEVYDLDLDTWRCLTLPPAPDDGCRHVWLGQAPLLSAYSADPERSFLGSGHVIRLRGDVRWVGVQLYQYEADAAWSTVMHHPEDVRPSTMACVDDEVWLVLTHFSCADNRWSEYDSILVIDSTGHRVSAFAPDVERVYSLVQGNGVIWALTGSPMTISTIDATGVTTHQFHVPTELRRTDACLVWAMDMLWISDPYAFRLHAIGVAESIDSGYAVSDWGISLGEPMGYSVAVGWDGVNFLVRTGDYLWKRNLSMQTIGPWPLPVDSYWGSTYGVQHSEIAWDGEALWVLHYGPRYRPGAAMLLSRFHIPSY